MNKRGLAAGLVLLTSNPCSINTDPHPAAFESIRPVVEAPAEEELSRERKGVRATVRNVLVQEEALPKININDETWTDAIAVQDILNDCIAAEKSDVRCSGGATSVCFRLTATDQIPLQIRVEETWEGSEAWGFRVRLNPVSQEQASVDFLVGPENTSSRDYLGLACQEGRRMLESRTDWNSLCVDPSDSHECYEWVARALEENQKLIDRTEMTVELGESMMEDGWSFQWGTEFFTFMVGFDSPVYLAVTWSHVGEGPVIRALINDSMLDLCEVPCDPDEAMEKLKKDIAGREALRNAMAVMHVFNVFESQP